MTPGGHARQLAAVARADRAAASAGAAVRRAWLALLRFLRPKARPAAHEAWHASRAILGDLVPGALRAVALALHDQARWAHASAARLLVRQAGKRRLAAAVVRRVLREEVTWADLLTGNVSNADIISLLFPPPPAALVDAVVYATGWQQRLASKLAMGPEALAQAVAVGIITGQGPREIARQILPAAQGVESAARRIARTEALRVAGAMQLRCAEQLGDMVIGYKVRATLDANTRPEHRARDGQVYYRQPGPGQKGLAEMPRPPIAADGRVEWNCRCFLVPVLRPE